MKIFIVNGAPTSGKTTFEEMVQKIMGESFCHILSSIGFVKYIASKCGWDGTKTPKNRKFLSDLKDLLTKYDDVPLKKIKENIKRIYSDYEAYGVDTSDIAIFIDIREPEEIRKACYELNAKSLLIRRPSAEQTEFSNHADAGVLNYNYDIIIENDGTLQDLAYTALNFIDEHELKFPHWKNVKITSEGEIKIF